VDRILPYGKILALAEIEFNKNVIRNSKFKLESLHSRHSGKAKIAKKASRELRLQMTVEFDAPKDYFRGFSIVLATKE
jgi:hypothetical protein